MKPRGNMKRVNALTMITFFILAIGLLGLPSFHVYAAVEPVRVPANVEWVSTGIYVEEGQTIFLVTHGTAITGPINQWGIGSKSGPDGQVWNLGCGQYEGAPPPCALDDAPYGALVGRVGPYGEPFLIGGSTSFTAPASGNLYLVVNDNLGFYYDNLSGFTVLINGG